MYNLVTIQKHPVSRWPRTDVPPTALRRHKFVSDLVEISQLFQELNGGRQTYISLLSALQSFRNCPQGRKNTAKFKQRLHRFEPSASRTKSVVVTFSF